MIIRSEVRLASPSHLTGRGGSKAAVLQTVAAARENTFVFRSDVKSYYASIRHDIRMREVGRFVDDPIALDLIHQYADRMMCDGGPYVSRRFTRRFQVFPFPVEDSEPTGLDTWRSQSRRLSNGGRRVVRLIQPVHHPI